LGRCFLCVSTQWTATQRADYEPKAMTAHEAARTTSGMSNPAGRATMIVGPASPLSDAPHSFVPTP
jgi:hypothetical protein